MGSVAPGEHLAVVGEDLIRDPVAGKGIGEDLTDRLGGRSTHEPCGHAEPGVIIDPGHDLQFGPIVEQHPTHHVHLPQLHGTFPFPATELFAALAPATELDQAVALEAPVDGRARGDFGLGLPELVLDAPWSPAGVEPAEFTDRCLHLRFDLVGTAGWAMRAVGQCCEPASFVPGDPVMHALA